MITLTSILLNLMSVLVSVEAKTTPLDAAIQQAFVALYMNLL